VKGATKKLELEPSIPPLEALPVEEIPEGPGWQYEPKWDGFRCLVFRDGDSIYLQSKAEKGLARYFPEIVQAAQQLKVPRFVLDGEIAVPVAGKFTRVDSGMARIFFAGGRTRVVANAPSPRSTVVAPTCVWWNDFPHGGTD
jgi:hypothetical protein